MGPVRPGWKWISGQDGTVCGLQAGVSESGQQRDHGGEYPGRVQCSLLWGQEGRKYNTLFDQIRPQAGLLPGDLSDQDKDGLLDRYEFTVAMHLVYRALQGDMIPDQTSFVIF